MPLNISETARVRDRVGSSARRWMARITLMCSIATLLSVGGCQLIMDDIPAADEDAGDAPPDASIDAGGGTDADAATFPEDAPSSDTAEDTAPPPNDAAQDADSSPDAPPDAASDTGLPGPDPDACDGAGEKTFYLDSDEDGHGDPRESRVACEAPADYVEDDGDCHDGNADVHEGQTAFFEVGYTRPGRSSLPSFDYNCDGEESFGPEQRLQACSAGLLACSGGGYDVNNQRVGFPGANPYCGSRDFLVCEGLPLLSGCNGMPSTATTAFTCR